MQVLTLKDERTLLAPFETNLFQRIKSAGSDRFGRLLRNGFLPLFHTEQL